MPEERVEEHTGEIAELMAKMGASGANTVDGHWVAFRDSAQAAMVEYIPKAPARAKRPWIAAVTLDMRQHSR